MSWRKLLLVSAVRALPWAANLINSRHYHHVTDDELRATRKTDTLFIFGSGFSVNSISEDEWRSFEQCDTLSFGWFVHQNLVRIDYHLIREVVANDIDPRIWWPGVHEYARRINGNPHYANTVLLIQGGWNAINGNRLVGLRLLPKSSPIFRYRNRSRSRTYQPPSSSFSEGLVHGSATLTDCINFAYVLGWKEIVLVGVDLYDRRYFWLGYDETRIEDHRRLSSHQDSHNTAKGIVPFLGRWREFLFDQGTELYVYNPKSLLAATVPVYPRARMGENLVGT